jgi:hypothetical protein
LRWGWGGDGDGIGIGQTDAERRLASLLAGTKRAVYA